MLTYLMSSACNGKRPAPLVLHRAYARPTLVSRLLRERNVARFVVAPAGFGKTSVAFEYAETVFSFNHVFWVDATSPCFLRDLDAGGLACGLRELDPEPFLVVFEDIPLLDPSRAELFCSVIDALLSEDCEVVVTCTPSHDVFSDQFDRMLINAYDLLLSNEEVDYLRTPTDIERAPSNTVPRAQRIAGVVWKGEDDEAFLTQALQEELPLDVTAALLAVMCMGAGRLSDVESIAHIEPQVFKLLATSYPYAGIDIAQGAFSTTSFSIAEIADAFHDRLSDVAAHMGTSGTGALALRIADALLDRGDALRACDVARMLAPAADRVAWLDARSERLERLGCLLRARGVYDSVGADELTVASHVAQATRCALLGENVSACVAARRAIACGPSLAQRATVQVVQSVCSVGDASEQAAARARDVCEVGAESTCGTYLQEIAAALDAVDAACDVNEALDAWGKVAAAPLSDALLYAAARLMQRLEHADEQVQAWEDLASMVAREVSRSYSETESLSLPCALAASAFQRAVETGVLDLPPLEASCALAASRMERVLLEQRVECESARTQKLQARRLHAATHPDVLSRDCSAQTISALEPARLTVNFFGGLDVSVGGVRVDSHLLRRQKVRALLALLVTNRGRDVSRNRVIDLLWPDSPLESARSNFYSVWSSLRSALSMSDGSCPYLIRCQNTVRIDASVLDSDVLLLDDVCRALLFGRPGKGGWGHLFSQVEDVLSGEFMPGDQGCEVIETLRRDCSARLVDALVAAARKLVETGDIQEGLWFARAALARDHSREDAYVAVMRAQIASLQRSAALETYFSCRRYLANDLGIDPSAETVRLYHSIIDAEPVLA